MADKFLIDIGYVKASLLDVQNNFDEINDALDMRRESMSDEIVANMIAGYEYVNAILKKDINLLERKGLHHFLELNNIILCGTRLERRKNYRQHILANTARFYDRHEFSISDLRRWAEKHRDDSPWKQAAGLYILQISWPQLFAEGNHRTGALLMSSILVRHGKPPFVLSVENAKGYFDP
jgi:Fic family protein